MSCNKEKEVLLYVLDMYKDMPYLWQKDHVNYMNKEMRDEGFKLLLQTYKNFDEDATIKSLKKKIENMRTTYVKEMKKVLASRHTATEDDEEYVPTLWYFDALSFLDYAPESSRDEDPLENVDSSDNEPKIVAKPITSVQRKRKKNDIVLLKQETRKQEKIYSPQQKLYPQNDEEIEIYGRSISLQMRGLDKKQLAIAQKLISDVIFHAKLDQLSENSYVVARPNEAMPSSSRLYKSEIQFRTNSPPSNYSSPSPSHQAQ